MKNTQFVNVSNFSDSNEISFKTFPMYQNWLDVYYKGIRIAIINGFQSPLQWVAPNGSNIPVSIIDKLERKVVRNLIK